jgi:hypothetical protein
MKSAFIVQHLHILPNGEENVKMIGLYASRNDAIAAATRLGSEPGFCDHPKIVNFDVDSDMQGFQIEEYEIGKDHWKKGYVTV